MNIQRWDLDTIREEIIPCQGGDYLKHSDHIAAMKELEERMMRFTDYYSNYCWEFARENSCPDMDMKQAFAYWYSQDKDESNPNRKYL